jgi:hypothetical protein
MRFATKRQRQTSDNAPVSREAVAERGERVGLDEGY